MENKTLYLPGFHLSTLRRKPRSASQILAGKFEQLKQNSLSQLGECFSTFIPKHFLQPAISGALSRQRFFSKENTFWAFFSQVLDADGGRSETSGTVCNEVKTLALIIDSRLLSGTQETGLS